METLLWFVAACVTCLPVITVTALCLGWLASRMFRWDVPDYQFDWGEPTYSYTTKKRVTTYRDDDDDDYDNDDTWVE